MMIHGSVSNRKKIDIDLTVKLASAYPHNAKFTVNITKQNKSSIITIIACILHESRCVTVKVINKNKTPLIHYKIRGIKARSKSNRPVGTRQQFQWKCRS